MYSFTDKKINELITVTCSLSKGLEDLSYIREKGLESWDEKYNISESYNKAKKFISLTEINRMFRGVERIYKLVFKEEWKEKLNEKIN